MKDFEVLKNKDGSFALINAKNEWIDGVFIVDDGRISAVAQARLDDGRLFRVRLPVTRQMLDHAPEMVEERLRMFAERWQPQEVE